MTAERTARENVDDLYGWLRSSLGVLASHEDQAAIDAGDVEYAAVVDRCCELFDELDTAITSLRNARKVPS